MMSAQLLITTSIVFALNALWHGLAAWHFALRPRRTLEAYTAERPVNGIAAELLRFLGALNLAVCVLACIAIARPAGARSLVALFLFLANLSQFVVDLRVRKLGLVNRRFDRTILFGDGFMSVVNLVTFVGLMLRR